MRFDKIEESKKTKSYHPKVGSKSPLRTCSSLNDIPDSNFHQVAASRRMKSTLNAFCSARIELDGIYYDFNEDLLIDKRQ